MTRGRYSVTFWSVAVAAAMIIAVGAIRTSQGSGEHPGYTCDPGGPYTTAECP